MARDPRVPRLTLEGGGRFMASYTVAAGEIGAHEKVLAADEVDEVTFAADLDWIEVFSSGEAAVYFTVDGEEPVVGSPAAFFLPAVPSVRRVGRVGVAPTVLRLISAGTPTYSVAKAT